MTWGQWAPLFLFISATLLNVWSVQDTPVLEFPSGTFRPNVLSVPAGQPQGCGITPCGSHTSLGQFCACPRWDSSKLRPLFLVLTFRTHSSSTPCQPWGRCQVPLEAEQQWAGWALICWGHDTSIGDVCQNNTWLSLMDISLCKTPCWALHRWDLHSVFLSSWLRMQCLSLLWGQWH